MLPSHHREGIIWCEISMSLKAEPVLESLHEDAA